MQKAKDFLELASHCESEAAKVQDKFLRDQLLSFAESYRVLAESTTALECSAEALENMRRRAQGPHVISDGGDGEIKSPSACSTSSHGLGAAPL